MKPQKREIVDDKDQIIGAKLRDEMDYPIDIYRVSALWLTNNSGQVLMAQRKFGKDADAGKWGPAVAGTVEEGETYEVNIYKEAEEEIGLSGVKFEIGPKLRIVGPRNYFCQWYTVVVDHELGDFTAQDEEVEALMFVAASDLVKDVTDNPDKYIRNMADTVKVFTGGSQ